MSSIAACLLEVRPKLSNDIVKVLLSRGYFPKELPPTFTTESFGSSAPELIEQWRSDEIFKEKRDYKTRDKKKKRGAYGYGISAAEVENLSIPKKGFERRSLNITHPIPQSLLTYELAKSWRKVSRWLQRRQFTMDSLEVDLKHPRGLKDINFALHRTSKAYIESTSDWLVKTDITRFYPSIYTHSIPWAAYGKERVKSDLKTYEGSLADRLDTIVRACNRNQTIGIHIGPETSRILAEIISARIDDTISAKNRDFLKHHVDRLQDDWFIGLSSFEKSESAIASISSAYRSYGLDINGSKTSIQRAMLHTEDAWQSELGAFLIHKQGPLHGSRLREFLSLVIRLQVQFQQQPVTNYALSVIASYRPLPSDAEMLESFLLKAAVVSPASMDRICQILLNLSFKTKRVSFERIEKRFNELISQNVINGHDYEVIWLLFTLRGLKQSVNSKILYESLKHTQSSALILTMLDMNSQGLCRRKLPISDWEGCVTEDRVRTEPVWLMAYEGIRHGWLLDPRSVMTKPFFQSMASRNVVFYDERRNVPKTEKTLKLRSAARKSNNLEISSLMFRLRHLDETY